MRWGIRVQYCFRGFNEHMRLKKRATKLLDAGDGGLAIVLHLQAKQLTERLKTGTRKYRHLRIAVDALTEELIANRVGLEERVMESGGIAHRLLCLSQSSEDAQPCIVCLCFPECCLCVRQSLGCPLRAWRSHRRS